MKVRAITIGMEPDFPLNSGKIALAGRFAKRVRGACEQLGVPVQSVRMATPPFPQYAGGGNEETLMRFIAALEQACLENGIDYCAIGPVDTRRVRERRWLETLPRLIARTEVVFTGVVLGTKGRPVEEEGARATARVMREIARLTVGGFGNLRFAGLVNCGPHIPFFPAAFHAGKPAFALALEAADLVAVVCGRERNLRKVSGALRQEMEERLLPLQYEMERLEGEGFVFCGIDLSPAPGPEREASIAYAIERLGLGRFGDPGTLTAAALITAGLKESALRKCGFCGLMLPVLEDAGLAERNNEGLLRLSSLLAYSAVCGTGLDTIPLPGDVSEEQLTALLLDVGVLGWKLGKPLSARFLPVPGKRAGEYTEFDFAYFVNTKVMAVE